MKLNFERYPMHQILCYFQENYQGSEDAVLEAFAEGSLIGSIKFPSYYPSWKSIPTEYWESIDASELISLSKKRPGHKQIDEVCVKGKALYDAELERLKSIAKAAASQNPQFIDKHLRALVFEELGVKEISDISDWLGLIRVFHELSIQLYEERSQKFDVLVLAENWTSFTEGQKPTETPLNMGGKPEDQYWPNLLWALVEKVVNNQGQSIHKIAGFDHRIDLARHMHDKVMKDEELQKGLLVSADRISQVLGDQLPKKKPS